jgi:hypothetical protein
MSRKAPEDPIGWLDIEGNRDKLKMAGKTIAAVAAAAWVVFLFYRAQPTPSPSAPPKLAKNMKVCRGENSTRCGDVDEFIGCSDPDQWAKGKCSDFGKKVLRSVEGGMCGWTVYEYTCSQQLPK